MQREMRTGEQKSQVDMVKLGNEFSKILEVLLLM